MVVPATVTGKPARIALFRATFVIVDVRVLVADDTLKWLAQLCQRQRVGGRPIGDEKNVAIDFKKFTDTITQALSPLIITVSCRCAGIRVLKRSASFRAKARGIVARELLAPLNHVPVATRVSRFEQLNDTGLE